VPTLRGTIGLPVVREQTQSATIVNHGDKVPVDDALVNGTFVRLELDDTMIRSAGAATVPGWRWQKKTG
jgi:hypothetical protein